MFVAGVDSSVLVDGENIDEVTIMLPEDKIEVRINLVVSRGANTIQPAFLGISRGFLFL